MNMKQYASDDIRKTWIAFGCIGAAVIGLILGIISPKPLADTFSPGALISFIAFLLSLSAVKERGNNLPAILAFTISFLAMAISIFCSGMAS